MFVENDAISNENPYPANFESFDEAVLSQQSQREFMKKIAARSQLYKLFPQTTSYVERKFHVYGKRKNADFHVETASGSRQT